MEPVGQFSLAQQRVKETIKMEREGRRFGVKKEIKYLSGFPKSQDTPFIYTGFNAFPLFLPPLKITEYKYGQTDIPGAFNGNHRPLIYFHSV
jgi:hypothetical protein